MSASQRRTTVGLSVAATLAMMLLFVASASAFTPNKLEFTGEFGRQVNLTQFEAHGGIAPELEDLCIAAPGVKCKEGNASIIAGGFTTPESVAAGPVSTGNDVYVAEKGNGRVQVFTSAGVFVSMFGWHVNATKTAEFEEAGNPHKITEAEENVCAQQERQAVSVDATAGTFTLTLSGHTTASINYNASSTEVQSALELLSNVGAGKVTVTGGPGGEGGSTPYLVTFGSGTSPAAKEPLMAANPSGLTSGNKTVRVEYQPNCQTGQSEPTGVAGVMKNPASIAVDQASGNVYLWDSGDHRVDEYKPNGDFVLMIGGEVNRAKTEAVKAKGGTPTSVELEEENVCIKGEVCMTGVATAEGINVPGAFKPVSNRGTIVVFGGPEQLLYVGDEGRVQEFEANGKFKRGLALTSLGPKNKVTALAVDGSGDLYLADQTVAGIQRLNPSGALLVPFDNASTTVFALALDPAEPTGRIVAMENSPSMHGVLFNASSGTKLGEFASPITPLVSIFGVTFNAAGQLYTAESGHRAIDIYTPATVAILVTGPLKPNSLTEFGATLTGEVNPEEVSETKAWFQYGTSETFGSKPLETPVQSSGLTGKAPVLVEAPLAGLRPNQKYYYRVAAEDANNPGEHATPPGAEPPLVGATLSFTTPAVPPAVAGAPSAFEITSTSAVLSATVNPENAMTVYGFQYGACESLGSCPGKVETAPLKSSAYAVLDAIQTATGLQPSTTYRYRLVAVNETLSATKETTEGQEGSFTTPPAPSPTAATLPASSVSATGATLNGAVDPDGAGATYSFQVGVYNGASTVYSAVASGSTGAGTAPVPEELGLTGLQPGTMYGYRVVISSGYGTAYGAMELFTTGGLPAVLFAPGVPPQLSIPHIAFPKTPKPLTNAQKLAKALKACRKKPKKYRLNCQRHARKRYRVSKKK